MKKLVAFVCCLSILSYIVPLDIVLANSDLSGTTFLVDSLSSNIKKEPGETLNIYTKFKNNSTETLENVNIKVNFSDSENITYNGNATILIGSDSEGIPVTSFVGTGFDFNSSFNLSAGGAIYFYDPTSASVTIGTDFKYPTINLETYVQATKGGNNVESNHLTTTINVDVKPHITDYYLTESGTTNKVTTIKGFGGETRDFYVEVLDHNGCSNIDGQSVTADLSALGLGDQTLTYDSCKGDGKTALFKKPGISTLNAVGQLTMPYTIFSFQDEDTNAIDPTNVHFGDQDKKDNFVIDVTSPGAPTVTNVAISDDYIGGPGEISSQISFSGNQPGEYKIAIDSCGQTDSGKIFQDYTAYTMGTQIDFNVNSANLADGNNNVVACIKNESDEEGSTTFVITKDTAAPSIGGVVYKDSVEANDSFIKFQCNEAGTYKVEILTPSASTLTAPEFVSIEADTEENFVISNGDLSNGTNTLALTCKDKAGNTDIKNDITITKIPAPPSMAGELTLFEDGDIDKDGIDGHDIHVTWNTTAGEGYSYFNTYAIYLLPTNTNLDTSTHTSIKNIGENNVGDFTGDETITKDSTGTDLISGGTYNAYVLIINSAGSYGTAGKSADVVLTGDVVKHADIVSARFIAGNKLEITTNATLDTVLGSHDASLITYNIGATPYTATSVDSVNDKKIILNIPTLSGNTSVTGTTLVVQPNAIHSAGGGYNNLVNFAGNITDGISPSIISFNNNTAALFGTFWKGNIELAWNFSENLDAATTSIRFERISGNPDATSHSISLNNPEYNSGAHTRTIDTDSLSLVCGTTYNIVLNGDDLAGNSATQSTITNFGYDNCVPEVPILNEFTTSGKTDVNFTWNTPQDDSGNGSGIKNYKLEIFTGDDCATSNQEIDNIAATNRTVTLTTGNYSWRVSARDNLDNLGNASTCSNFLVDTNVPTFNNEKITDITLTSDIYTKSGDTVEVTADITNTNINNITANLASLTGGAFTDVSCSATGDANITCSFVGDKVTYSFPVGFGGAITEGLKQVQIKAKNTSGLNQQSIAPSITIDANTPVVANDTITSPNGGEVLGGNELTITWNPAKITDTIGLKEIELLYKGGAQATYTSLYKGPNSGSYTWDITALNTAADYSIKIIATDNVGNTNEDTTDADFTLDKNAPTVPANTVQIPNGGEITAGNTVIAITWNSGIITDAGGLKVNPITLEYTTDGTNYNQIATDLANSGSYNWTIPNINVTTAKVKLIAEDTVGNTAEDVSDTSFSIDSILPEIAFSFAGGGGTTPPNNAYLSNSGIDISGTSSDAHMASVSYIFHNTTDDTYYNGTNFVAGEQLNTICTDGTSGGTDNSCDNIGTTINPTIEAGKNYAFTIRAIDEAGNKKDSHTVIYHNDVDGPIMAITTADNSFITNSLNIVGTASDAISGMSSVKLQIKRNSDNFYFDGTNFVNSLNSINTTTSNNYANWNYNFTAPAGDSEGESYEVKAIGYDKAYKTNNSNEVTITLVKDSTGPVIVGGTNFITQPLSGDVFAGGDNTNITWNSVNVSDAPAGIKANSVTLEYTTNGSDFTEIANSLANNGTYSWTGLPSIDSNSVRIRFTIEDNAGNTSSQLGNTFTIDSTAPTIDTIETMENGIANGKINSLKVIFSENIDDSSVNLAHFTISSGIGNPTVLETGATADDNTIILKFAETGNTGLTPTLTYAGDSVEDLAGKKLANAGPLSSLDKAIPRMLETNIYDDDKNGKLDKIEIIFSENIAASTTLNGFTLHNAYAGMSLSNASSINDKINLTLNESSNFDTSSGSLELSLNNTIYVDVAGNLAGNFSNNALNDKAPPVKVSAITNDSEGFGAGGFGKIDQIVMTMSENIVGANLGDFTVGNLAAGASVNTLNSAGNTLTFEINETTDNNDTAQIPTIAYTAGSLADSAGNNTENITTFNVTDGVSPIVTARETIDNDGNGQIDRIRFTFSENLNDNLGGLNINVAGYTINNYNSQIANDNIVFALVSEKSITDTDATPNARIVSNSTVADNATNNALSEGSFTATSDKTGPVVIGARYDEGGAGVADDKIYLTFSEDITAASIDTNAGGANSDFIIVSGGAFAGNSTTSINSATEVVITMGAGATALNSATSKIGIRTGALEDSLNNPSPTQGVNNQVELSGSIVINEVMFSQTADNQYIELRNLGNAIVDLSNWTIENAGGNGVTITIPGGQSIAANGYYLISKTNQATSNINVAPDLVDASVNLNPTGQNNLVLKDSLATTFDSALATYPAGDKDIPKSMERKNIPGNGLIAGNWYTAESSVGFDDSTPKGTPKTANIFDSNAPTITSYSPVNNELFAATPTVSFKYTDDIVGVDDTSSTFVIQKWNGTDSYGADLSGTKLGSSNVQASEANYTLNTLDYGKYKVTFTIDDIVGNTATQIIEFYVDEFTMTVDTTPIDIGDLDDGNLVISSAEATVTITTVGTGFTLNANKSAIFASESNNIADWNGTTGFGIDIYKDEDGSISAYNGSIVALNNVTLANIAKDIDPNGNLKTYTYKIKYGAKINTFQTAGNYNTTSIFTTSISY